MLEIDVLYLFAKQSNMFKIEEDMDELTEGFLDNHASEIREKISHSVKLSQSVPILLEYDSNMEVGLTDNQTIDFSSLIDKSFVKSNHSALMRGYDRAENLKDSLASIMTSLNGSVYQAMVRIIQVNNNGDNYISVMFNSESRDEFESETNALVQQHEGDHIKVYDTKWKMPTDVDDALDEFFVNAGVTPDSLELVDKITFLVTDGAQITSVAEIDIK